MGGTSWLFGNSNNNAVTEERTGLDEQWEMAHGDIRMVDREDVRRGKMSC